PGVAGGLAAGAGRGDPVAADAAAAEPAEDLGQRLLAELPDAPRRQLPAVPVPAGQALLLEPARDLLPLAERPLGLGAEAVADLPRVELVEVAGARRLLEGLLEGVEVLQLAHDAHRRVERERLGTREGVLACEVGRRSQRLHQ